MRPGRRRGGRVAVAALAVPVAAALVVLGWPGGTGPEPVAALSGEVGNGRPHVARYDGQLVHRCTALAVYLGGGADPDTVRTALHAAGQRADLPLTDLPPGVLSPETLELQVPDVVACLPVGADTADADRVLPAPLPGEDHGSVEPVLVHDLVFDVRTGALLPYDVARAVDREGVLADVLGRYGVELPTGRVRVHYTGPLLSDDEVEGVRAALARAAHAPGSAVSVAPGDPRAPGVDLREGRDPTPATDPAATGHHHAHG